MNQLLSPPQYEPLIVPHFFDSTKVELFHTSCLFSRKNQDSADMTSGPTLLICLIISGSTRYSTREASSSIVLVQHKDAPAQTNLHFSPKKGARIGDLGCHIITLPSTLRFPNTSAAKNLNHPKATALDVVAAKS